MGCEFALHFDYTLPGMEKVEKDKVLSLARYRVFCKMWAQFQKIPKKIKKKLYNYPARFYLKLFFTIW